MLRSAALRAAGPAPGTAFRRRAIATLAASAVIGAGLAVPASAAPPAGEEPGVTLRTFAFGQAPSEICTLKEGTTPNVDKLMPTISWTEADEFGMEDNFLTHVLATLEVPADGEYGFRLTSDDGSKLYIDDELVIDHDGLHGAEPKDGSVTLTAGYHSLFIEHIEAGGGQELHLEWQVPGASGFELVPNSALSTEADVVRVTAPGTKYCEGATDTAGDGLRLDSVNPNYDLTNLRPEGFEPKVSGLAFTPDGQLAVSTTGDVSSGDWTEDPTSGEVYFLDGVAEADGPEDVTVTKVADELLNPMGIEVIDDSIFVSERYQLTQLTDPDGDGFYDVHTTIAEWPDGGNFHEFAFGLVHDEDYFYVNLSVAINNGGATTDPQPAQNRGTSIKIDRETGEVTYVAGGLRTPNGIAFGPNGDLFATDNQGAWLPSNKLVHIEQGKFFNHYTNPDGPFDDQPVSPPAVWIPQNEIGNSPSQPALLQEGPFAGQMLIGDVTYGGLQRAFLEEVDGEYQGAVFRHSAGFESGINRTIVGPDGAIYVGGTGEGGNWGEAGKLRYGLQKLTPVNDDTFDMKEVRVIEGGFEIEYTQPVSEETAATIADAYQVQQWRYQPTQQYGGPKIDEHPLDVTAAEVSEDRTTVTLAIDGLTPGYVVHLRSPRPFTDEDGQELWNTEAWYTLNSLPGYVAPPEDQYYEGEDAIPLGASTVAADHSNYSGTGFAANIQAVGSGRQFQVNVDEAGTYPVNLRYANGIHPYPELRSKNVSLYVNGEDMGQWTLPTTGDWKTWAWATQELELEAGANTIALQYDEGDEGNVNFDVLSIGENPDICTPVEPEDGYTALFDGTLASLNDGWRMAGPGGFGRQDDCSLRGEGGMGLLWYTEQEFEEYSLTLDWKLVKDDNGGVFVGFPDPGDDPWVAVDQGYEIQIDATDEVDRTTGAVYTFQGADLEARDEALNPVGQWNSYDIRVQGDNIKIYLNDVLVNDFTSTDPARDLSSGFIGFQNHGGGETVFYRNVQVKDLSAVEVTPEAVTFADEDGTENDTFTVPEVEGVEYVVDGEVVAAGPNPGAGTVTVTARAQDGYVLAEGATAEWTFAFSTDAAPVRVPVDQVSIGLYSLIPWVNAEGQQTVLARLAEIGLENIEPYGGNLNPYTAEQVRAMAEEIGLEIPSSHFDVGEAGFDETLEYVETIGQEYVGSGGFPAPGIGSYENTLATAAAMNRLGERSVEAGVGKFFGHNHDREFTTVYEHEGEQMSAWEILVAETNPEYVTFQVDVAWAAHAGVDVPALLEEHGDRIELLHIKDATGLGGSIAFTNLGEGDVPLQEILAAAQEHADIAYYVMEYDVAPQGEDFVETGFEYLTGQEAGAEGSRPVEVTAAEVTFSDEDGTEDDMYTVPWDVGVEYLVDGEVVEAGERAGTGTVTVTARALAGFVLADGTTEWTHTFSEDGGEPELVEVTPAPVTFTDEDGTEDDVYTVPAVEGVEYVVDGEVVEAGEYDGAGTVTVTARPAEGFVFPEGAVASWTHTFSADGGEPELVEVTPAAVVFADGPGADNDTVMIPSVVGVEYLVNGEVTAAGTHPASGTVTVVARALDGYVLAEGATAEWVLTFTTDGGLPPAPDRRSAEFHLSNSWRGSTDVHFMYGRWADEVLIGDWDGDGKDTIAVRRGNVFHVSNAQQGGDADAVITYGRPGDTILVGDWDGDGTDTFAVRRGNTYHVKNSMRGGDADAVFHYGRENDAVMVGDWDGNGTDTFAVRRAATYHVKNSLRGGDADTVFTYGRAADVTLAGDWDGDGRDTFTVRRGATYHVSNSLRGGAPDTVVTFGRAGDEVHVGDWDGNGTDTLGVRRPVGPAPVAKEVRSAAKLG